MRQIEKARDYRPCANGPANAILAVARNTKPSRVYNQDLA